MTDDAAKPAAPGGQTLRSRKGATSLVQYLLLQAVIAALCIFVLRLPLPEPMAQYRVVDFTLSDGGAARAVTLPDFLHSQFSVDQPAASYAGHFAWSAREAGRAWSVYLPRFTNGVEVLVNGVEILDSRRDPEANRPDRATPEIALIPASLLRDGSNDLVIRLYGMGPDIGLSCAALCRSRRGTAPRL